MTTAMDIRAALKTLGELRVNGKILQLVQARKGHKCTDCGLPIEPQEYYYRVYRGGAGLADIKFPDTVHKHCMEKVYNLVKEVTP